MKPTGKASALPEVACSDILSERVAEAGRMLHHKVMGTGIPVVILHGVTLDLRFMIDTCEAAFRGAGPWQRLYVDMPGHGESPGRSDIRTHDDLLHAVLGFIDVRLPEGRFALLGFSRGSYIARGIVHLRSERVLGAALVVPGGNPSSDPARLPPVQVIEPDPAIAPHLEEHELWPHENLSAIQSWSIVEKRRQIIAPGRAGFDAAQEARVKQAFDFSFAAEEAETTFDGPSLIVAGRQDSISGYLDAMDLAQRYTRSTLAVLDTAGHALCWERPELYHALLRDWLDRVAQQCRDAA